MMKASNSEYSIIWDISYMREREDIGMLKKWLTNVSNYL